MIMATIARRRSGATTRPIGIGARRVGRRGLFGLARIVSLIATIVVGLLLLGIALVVLEANRHNEIVNALLDAGRWLAQPFDNIFKPDGRKEQIAVNWGLAALVYAVAASFVAKLLRR